MYITYDEIRVFILRTDLHLYIVTPTKSLRITLKRAILTTVHNLYSKKRTKLSGF